jgi:hypothetical protein
MKTNKHRIMALRALRRCVLVALLSTAATAGASSASWAETPYFSTWVRQLGTSTNDTGYEVSADGLGNVYISGYTGGLLGDRMPVILMRL